MAVDPSGNLYFSDSSNGAIRKVAAGTGIITTVVGNGAPCTSYGGDGGASTSATLCFSSGIAVDAAGDIYIADSSNNRVREAFAPATPPSAQAALPTFSIQGGTYASPQTVIISDTTPGASNYVTVDGTTPNTAIAPGYSFPLTAAGTVTIQAIAAAPGYLTSAPASATYTVTSFSPVITTFAGSGRWLQGLAGTGGPALNLQSGLAQSLAVDKGGNLYIVDTINNVVWQISSSTGTASPFAGNGMSGYQEDGGPAVKAELAQPRGIAFDSAGNLYIADSGNDVIRKVDAVTGLISTVAGTGPYPGATGNSTPATSTPLRSPAAVAVDSADNFYIADSDNYVIHKVTAKTGDITTVAGNGKSDFSGDGGPATSAGIQIPNLWLSVRTAIFISVSRATAECAR